MQVVAMAVGLLDDHVNKKINSTKYSTEYLKLIKEAQKLAK